MSPRTACAALVLTLAAAAQAGAGKTAVICPSGEKPLSYQLGGKTVIACQPASEGAFCSSGRVLMRSPATGQSTCSTPDQLTWACPAGEAPHNFKNPVGKVDFYCAPAKSGQLCASGRVLIFSPGNGQTQCLPAASLTWACPKPESIKNYRAPNGKIEWACLPAGKSCGAGRAPTFNAVLTAQVCTPRAQARR